MVIKDKNTNTLNHWTAFMISGNGGKCSTLDWDITFDVFTFACGEK